VERGPDEPLDVICSGCGTTFCFNCKEEAHRPVSREGGQAAPAGPVPAARVSVLLLALLSSTPAC